MKTDPVLAGLDTRRGRSTTGRTPSAQPVPQNCLPADLVLTSLSVHADVLMALTSLSARAHVLMDTQAFHQAEFCSAWGLKVHGNALNWML